MRNLRLPRLLAAALSLAPLVLSAALSFAQAPPPVPALPDTERRTQYSISASTCACSVGFALFGTGSDVDQWLEVWVAGTRYLSTDPTHGWALTSATGTLATIPRPITDAVLTFTSVQTGTVQIVGAERPRRSVQVQENQGVPARAFNQAITDLVAQNRETWDKTSDLTGRALQGLPGESIGPLPPAATRKNGYLCFDGTTGNTPVICPANTGGGAVTSGAFDVAFCNTVGYLVVRLTGGWVCSQGIPANPVWFGADPTGAADSATAFNAALSASSYVLFPPGHFKFLSAVNYTIPAGNHSATVAGSGQDNTFLDWSNNTNGLQFVYNSGLSSAHVRDLTIETGSVNANNGLRFTVTTLNSVGAASSASDVTNVTVRGNDTNGGTNAWANGILINNVSNVSFINDFFFGTLGLAGNGVTVQGNVGLSSQAVVFNFVSCTFVDLGAGIVYGPAAQGLTVANSNFTSGTNGIFVTGAISPLTQLSVTGSQFATANDINLNSLVSSLHIVGNLFIQAASQNAISLASTQGAYIIGNNFAGGGASSNNGITITATVANSTTEIIGNSFHSLATGINLSGASSAAIIANNDFFSNTNAILNSSTGVLNRIHDNVGYNPLGVTAAATVGASPATITAGPSPETHYVKQSANFNAAITQSGNALCTTPSAAVPCVIELGPNEAMVVTWTTTAPTDTKVVH